MKWFPHTKYVGGQLTVYDFWVINDLSYDDIHEKVDGLGYSGMKTMYYRVPTMPMDAGMKLLQNESDCLRMIGFGKENNFSIDIYVEHYTELEITAEHYHNVHPEEFNADTNEFLDLEELDEDYHFSESEYLFDEVDDQLFSENVDSPAEWVGKLHNHLGLTNDDDISEDKSDSEAGLVDTLDSDSLEMFFEEIFAEEVPGMKKIKRPVYKDSDDPQWEVGMTFKDHHECREAITKHSYKEGRMVWRFHQLHSPKVVIF